MSTFTKMINISQRFQTISNRFLYSLCQGGGGGAPDAGGGGGGGPCPPGPWGGYGPGPPEGGGCGGPPC